MQARCTLSGSKLTWGMKAMKERMSWQKRALTQERESMTCPPPPPVEFRTEIKNCVAAAEWEDRWLSYRPRILSPSGSKCFQDHTVTHTYSTWTICMPGCRTQQIQLPYEPMQPRTHRFCLHDNETFFVQPVRLLRQHIANTFCTMKTMPCQNGITSQYSFSLKFQPSTKKSSLIVRLAKRPRAMHRLSPISQPHQMIQTTSKIPWTYSHKWSSQTPQLGQTKHETMCPGQN